jgi:hypothetical protein
VASDLVTALKGSLVVARVAIIDSWRFPMHLVTAIAWEHLHLCRVRMRVMGVYLHIVHHITLRPSNKLLPASMLMTSEAPFIREPALFEWNPIILLDKLDQLLDLLLDGRLMTFQAGDAFVCMCLDEIIGILPSYIGFHDMAETAELRLFVILPQANPRGGEHHNDYSDDDQRFPMHNRIPRDKISMLFQNRESSGKRALPSVNQPSDAQLQGFSAAAFLPAILPKAMISAQFCPKVL